jgi:hypothetical protein
VLETWRQRNPLLHFCSWEVTYALRLNDNMLNGTPPHHRRIKLHGAVIVLWKSRILCSSAEIDFCLTTLCQLVPRLMADITAHSWRIRCGWLFTRTAGVRCHFAQGKCKPSSPLWCAKSGATMEQGGVGTFSTLSRSYLHVIIVCLTWERTSLG